MPGAQVAQLTPHRSVKGTARGSNWGRKTMGEMMSFHVFLEFIRDQFKAGLLQFGLYCFTDKAERKLSAEGAMPPP